MQQTKEKTDGSIVSSESKTIGEEEGVWGSYIGYRRSSSEVVPRLL
jgi:hypothetical protein